MEINEKYNEIIGALVLQVKNKYCDDVDLIGVIGSVSRGDADKFSNVDFIVVASDETDVKIDYSFIIDGEFEVGYRIKSITWEEYQALIGTAFAGRILQAYPFYFRNKDVEERFYKIRRQAEEHLILPLDEKKMAKIKPLCMELKMVNCDVQITTKELSKYYAVKLLLLATEILVDLNCGYYRFKIEDRIEDIKMLSILPKDFQSTYALLLESNDEKIIKSLANEITAGTLEIFTKLEKVFSTEEKKQATSAYENFVAEVNSKYIKSQIYADKKLSALVGYMAYDQVMMLKKHFTYAPPVSEQDVLAPNKLSFAMKSIKQAFEEEYGKNGSVVRRFSSVISAIENM